MQKLMLYPEETHKFYEDLLALKCIESVTKGVQENCISVSDVCFLCNVVIDKFSSTCSRLNADAAIVHIPKF